MKLVCKICNSEVSKQVTELNDSNLLNLNDGQDYIPEGFYIVLDNDNFFPMLKGSIIINIQDLINSNYHSIVGRLNGCCGYDGCDGMNRVCLCNHDIGTECSDCWMPHFVALNSECVKFTE